MDVATQARINELLLEREELLLRIHAIEKEAAALLGEPYPFERPPLPSDQNQKGRKKQAPGRARDAASGKPAQLRPLAAGEAGWRVTYEQHGVPRTEVHRSATALNALLACQGSALRVTCIEVLDTSGAVRAVVLGEG